MEQTVNANGRIEIDDLRTITTDAGEVVVVSRLNEMRLVDENTGVVLTDRKSVV